MPRETFVMRGEGDDRKPVPKHLAAPLTVADQAKHHIMGDLKEYRAIGLPGAPVVTSRSQHRDLLRRHGKIEVGNEIPALMKVAPDFGPSARHDVVRAMREKGLL